jgi:hypothetical protein
MRNLSSALLWIGFVYFIYLNGFHWIYLVLLIGGIAIWEYPVKENIELVKAQIQRTKMETESIKWNIKLVQVQTNINLRSLELMRK